MINAANADFYLVFLDAQGFSDLQRDGRNAMFNGSDAARRLGGQYSERSLSAKRFDRILREIVSLIRSANKASEDIAAGAPNPQR